MEWVEDYDPIFKAYEQSLSYWKMGALRTKSVRRLSPLVMGFDVRIGMQSFISLMVEICEHINKVSSSRKYSLKRHIILA